MLLTEAKTYSRPITSSVALSPVQWFGDRQVTVLFRQSIQSNEFNQSIKLRAQRRLKVQSGGEFRVPTLYLLTATISHLDKSAYNVSKFLQVFFNNRDECIISPCNYPTLSRADFWSRRFQASFSPLTWICFCLFDFFLQLFLYIRLRPCGVIKVSINS